MDDIKALEKTFNQFLSGVKELDTTYNFNDLNQLEMKLVRTLQLMEAEIGYAGRGLYDMIQDRRRKISAGEVGETNKEKEDEDDKSSDAGRVERQSNRKTKRTRKQR